MRNVTPVRAPATMQSLLGALFGVFYTAVRRIAVRHTLAQSGKRAPGRPVTPACFRIVGPRCWETGATSRFGPPSQVAFPGASMDRGGGGQGSIIRPSNDPAARVRTRWVVKRAIKQNGWSERRRRADNRTAIGPFAEYAADTCFTRGNCEASIVLENPVIQKKRTWVSHLASTQGL
jgi:hypothetical protein